MTAIAAILGASPVHAQLRIQSLDTHGNFVISNAFTNGVVEIEISTIPYVRWFALKSVYSTQSVARASIAFRTLPAFYRARATDLTPDAPNGRVAFTNMIGTYGRLTTLAGAGGSPEAINKWRPEFEGGPATQAELSRPHIALADDAGNVYIADKDAHAVRKVLKDGRIVTVAGVNAAGDGPDEATLGTSSALAEPNGLWITRDNTVYILDLANSKIRKLDTNGLVSTLFADTGGITAGRGLWVNDDASLVYYCSGTLLKQWTPGTGTATLSGGFVELGNIALNASGDVIATDRFGHRVWCVGSDGGKTAINGTGAINGGGDGWPALEAGLNEVRGVWMLPTGAYFLATHRGSKIWHVDTAGFIHLFLNGDTGNTHAGDGTWFYNPLQRRIAEPRAITADREGNLLITEHDSGYIRKIEFKRLELD